MSSAVIREMKYYSDEKMRSLREAFEKEVLAWPRVARKEMMGCLVYFRGRKIFAFLVTEGIVLMKLSPADRDAVAKRPGAKPFEMAGQASSKMVQLPLGKVSDLRPLLPYIRTSYDAAT